MQSTIPHPRGPNVRPFCAMVSSFQVTAQFEKSAANDLKITLTHPRSKGSMCILHTPIGAKIFALWFAVFDVMLHLGKTYTKWTWHPEVQKVPTCLWYTHPEYKFSSVSNYNKSLSRKLSIWALYECVRWDMAIVQPSVVCVCHHSLSVK